MQDIFQNKQDQTAQTNVELQVELLLNELATFDLSQEAQSRMTTMISLEEINIEEEVKSQYYLLKSMQKDILNKSNKSFVKDASPTQVSSMLSQVNSFLALYLKSKKDFDVQAEMMKLREAILAGLEDLPPASKQAFVDTLEASVEM